MIPFVVVFGSVKRDRLLKTNQAVTINSDSIKVSDDSSQVVDSLVKKDKIIAYYFHSKHECSSCKKIMDYTHEAIYSAFGNELKKGILQWQPIYVDEPSNRHYVEDYKLYTKSVVLSKIESGKEVKWKNLSMVWQLLRNKEKFEQYIQKEVRSYLEGN